MSDNSDNTDNTNITNINPDRGLRRPPNISLSLRDILKDKTSDERIIRIKQFPTEDTFRTKINNFKFILIDYDGTLTKNNNRAPPNMDHINRDMEEKEICRYIFEFMENLNRGYEVVARITSNGSNLDEFLLICKKYNIDLEKFCLIPFVDIGLNKEYQNSMINRSESNDKLAISSLGETKNYIINFIKFHYQLDYKDILLIDDNTEVLSNANRLGAEVIRADGDIFRLFVKVFEDFSI